MYLAANLNKPIPYFFPERLVPRIGPEKMTILEQELLLLTRQLEDSDLIRLIVIARAFVNLGERNS